MSEPDEEARKESEMQRKLLDRQGRGHDSPNVTQLLEL